MNRPEGRAPRCFCFPEVLLTILLLLAAGSVSAGPATRFAIIGDYGVDNANERDVSNLVRTNFQPEFIVTAGDNNYLGAASIDEAIGKYYHPYIGNYSGAYGSGATSNRFFPALGNHDWFSGSGYGAHTNYFTLPGNERYYDFVRGPAHIFVLNSDPNEPNGNTAASTQALWFSNRLAASASPWRIVVIQDPPYSSSEPHAWTRWPFQQWGASLVVSGDAHHYERIMLDGLPYVVNGAGGAGLIGFGTPASGSVVRYNAAHGAMLMIATTTNLVSEFWSVANGGTLIDRFTLGLPLRVSLSLATNRSVRISWPTNSDDYVLESCGAVPALWTTVAEAPVVVGENKTVTLSTTGQAARYFRLRR